MLSCITSAAPVQKSNKLKANFNGEKIQGVNLGGWFVLEPWITPSIFEPTPDDCVDEWTLSAYYGKTEMKKRMEQHWSTWITADDFSSIASYGLNLVRIPIGYWSISPIEGDPYVQGAYEHLSKAIGWASDNGLQVMIDLHGAPGSQNGFDNSGHKGAIDWTQGDTIQQTHKALNKIRDDHASNPTVVAIELVNEPEGPELNMNTVRQFYMDGWGDLKDSNVVVTFHDAFEGVNAWNNWGSGMWNLMEDTHHYEVFNSTQLEMSLDDHIGFACSFGGQMASNNKWTIAGEFTGAMTDCAQWLNGRGVGARYDGTYNVDGTGSWSIGSCDGLSSGTIDGLSQQQKSDVSQFIQAQMTAFEWAEGWIFWTCKWLSYHLQVSSS